MNYIKSFLKKNKTWLNSRLISKKGLILLYHSIGHQKKEFDPYSLTVSPENFSTQLKIIKNYFNIISLQEMIKRISNNEMTDNSIVVTFDDGYANNLFIAQPLLEQYQVPATFFISSGYWDDIFWWDIITANLKNNKSNKIIVADKEFVYTGDPDQKKKIHEEIFYFIRASDYQKRKIILSDVKKLSMENVNRDLLRCMTQDEVKKFSRNKLVDIGGHTVIHTTLSTLDKIDQENEILKNKTELEELLQKEVNFFAYPHGDFSNSSIEILKENSFSCGLAVRTGVNHKKSDLFQLNRIQVDDWETKTFKSILKYWL